MSTTTTTATMRDARSIYFADNHFGTDGGYNDAWVDLSLGPVPLGIPNWKSRRLAVQYHDLHHILTGYRTDWAGEFEISAWEIGAGCKTVAAAWILNLLALATGTLVLPRRTFAAFVRGRRSRSLYGERIDELLAQSVGEVRTRMSVPQGEPKADVGDGLLFAASALAGSLLGAVTVPLLGPPLVLIGLLARIVADKHRKSA